MAKQGIRNTGLDPYVYLESASGESVAIGIDDTDDNFKIVTSAAAGATPSSVNPTLNVDNASGFTEIRAVTNLTLDATSGIEINGAGAAINIGNDPVAQPINIGTGAAARTITIGNTTGATGVTVNVGTGNANFGTSSTAHTTTLGTNNTTSDTVLQSGSGGIDIQTSSNGPIDIETGSGAINIGASAGGKIITVGNTTGTTAVNINIGTGDFTMTSATGTLISQLDTGEMTKPLQPAFLAELQATDSNVTGNGATYTLGSGNALVERYDQGGDFATSGTFTASVTGRYYLYATMRVGGLEAGMTSAQFRITTSNRSYFWTGNAGNLRTNTNEYTFHLNVVADMDAADTATNTLVVNLGSGDVADITGSATTATVYFGGCLLV